MDIKDELIDRFNEYPIQVERLLDIVEMRIHALNVGVLHIKDTGKAVEVQLSEKVQKILTAKHYSNKPCL